METCPTNGDCSRCPNPCESAVVCHCLKVTEAVIIEAISSRQATNIRELRSCTGAGEGCMACIRKLKRYIELHVCCQDNAVLPETTSISVVTSAVSNAAG